MPNLKIVRTSGGLGLLTTQEVLDELQLRNGQSVTDSQAQEIMRLNAVGLVADIKLQKAAGVSGLPDTKTLEELIRR